jgi:hypothetical protein
MLPAVLLLLMKLLSWQIGGALSRLVCTGELEYLQEQFVHRLGQEKQADGQHS